MYMCTCNDNSKEERYVYSRYVHVLTIVRNRGGRYVRTCLQVMTKLTRPSQFLVCNINKSVGKGQGTELRGCNLPVILHSLMYKSVHVRDVEASLQVKA